MTKQKSGQKTCPICKLRARSAQFTPFCSSRCRDRDLVNWLEDGYALSGPPADPDVDPDGFAAPPPRDSD